MIFGQYNTETDFDLILTSQKINTPALKTYNVDLPAGDGSIDLSEFFGGIKLHNRILEFEFAYKSADIPATVQAITNALHGSKLSIVTDDDTDWYYVGRITVTDGARISKTVGKVIITCDCEPFKYNLTQTVVSGVIASGSLTLNCVNSRKSVIPTITTSGVTNITFGSYTASLPAGTHTITSIIFDQGVNTLTITGADGIAVNVKYQEGAI